VALRPRLSPRAVAPLALALCCAALVAGCSSGAASPNGLMADSPAQIVAAARAAAAGAASVRVAGSIVRGGKPISINMELVAGQGGQGRVALEGISFRLVGIDGALYVSGASAFYRRLAGAAAARVMRGKWLKGAQHGALRALLSLTRLGSLLSAALSAHGALSRAADATVEGQRALAVSDTASGGTLYVASTGTPYPLEIVERGAERLMFERWNQAVTLTVPVNAIDIRQLQSGR
jgi:hypothetical protein